MTDEIIRKLEEVRYHLTGGSHKAVIDEAIEYLKEMEEMLTQSEENTIYLLDKVSELKTEIKKWRNRFNKECEAGTHFANMYDERKAEIERLKSCVMSKEQVREIMKSQMCIVFKEEIDNFIKEELDNFVKEMAGAENENL